MEHGSGRGVATATALYAEFRVALSPSRTAAPTPEGQRRLVYLDATLVILERMRTEMRPVVVSQIPLA